MTAGRWDLVITRGLDGATNMAVDHVLATFSSASGRPILRLYDWQPPAISLGFHQDVAEIDLEAARARGFDVVRRPTGGRAILHAEEITYSVVIPRNHPLYDRSASRIYEVLSRCFLRALAHLKLEVEVAAATRGDNKPARTAAGIFCFASSARHEIKAQGRKVLGSAQRRYLQAVLQHGSLLLGQKHLELVHCVQVPEGEKNRLWDILTAKTASLLELTGRTVTFEEAALAIQQGFADELRVEFVARDLTERELEQALELKGSFHVEGGMDNAESNRLRAGVLVERR